MTNEFKIISEDALKTLCKAIQKVSTIGEILDDTNSVTDKTYSSFEIDRRLNTKIDKTQLTAVLDDTVTNEQIPGAKVVVDELGLKANDSEVVKKTDISTSINNRSTDDEVPSAKAMYTEFSKGFNGILPEGILQIPNNDMNELTEPYHYETVIDTSNIANFPPVKTGITRFKLKVEIVSLNVGMYRQEIEFQAGPVNQGTWYRNFIDGIWSPWNLICTTTVANVSETSIEIDESALGIPIWNNRSKYKVINGICYVTVELNVNAHDADIQYGYKKVNITSLPKIGFSTKGILNIQDSNSITAVLDKETTDLKLHGVIRAKEGSYALQGSFSYPVAE